MGGLRVKNVYLSVSKRKSFSLEVEKCALLGGERCAEL